MKKQYHEKFTKLLKYIDSHLSEQLTVCHLSQQVHFSAFHFHRQFSSYIGQPLSQYIQQQRLRRAAFQLVFRKELSIGEIAYQASFSNAESFSRAFKKITKQSPSAYRKNPCSPSFYQDFTGQLKDSTHMTATNHIAATPLTKNQVSIVNFPETQIALYIHRGSPNTIMASVQHFIEWRKNNNLPPNKSATYNLVYDDPNTTPTNEFTFGIAAQIQSPIAKNSHRVVNQTIPAGKCARLRHFGSDSLLEKSFELLYGQWLPESGEELRDQPCIMHRVAMFPDVSESETIIDIYLPLT